MAPETWSTKSHEKQMKKKDDFVLTGFMMIALKIALSNSQSVESVKQVSCLKNYFAEAYFTRQKLSKILKLFPQGAMDETEGGNPVSHGS